MQRNYLDLYRRLYPELNDLSDEDVIKTHEYQHYLLHEYWMVLKHEFFIALKIDKVVDYLSKRIK